MTFVCECGGSKSGESQQAADGEERVGHVVVAFVWSRQAIRVAYDERKEGAVGRVLLMISPGKKWVFKQRRKLRHLQ